MLDPRVVVIRSSGPDMGMTRLELQTRHYPDGFEFQWKCDNGVLMAIRIPDSLPDGDEIGVLAEAFPRLVLDAMKMLAEVLAAGHDGDHDNPEAQR